MQERGPRNQQARKDAGHQEAWPIGRVGETLRATPQPVEDAALGEGHLLQLGPERTTALELYSQAGVVRLWAEDTYLELTHQTPPHLRRRGVIFTAHASPDNPAAERRRLIVTDQGEVLLSLTPTLASAALQREKTALSPANRTYHQSQAETPVSDDSTAPQPLSDKPSERPQTAQQEKERRPRLTLTGRVGKAPAMRTTRNGVLIARFPLAVHSEEGETTWHQIVAFNEKAETAQDTLAKGQVVEVIGYLHEREQTTREGKKRRIQEVYAAVIKTPRPQ